MKFETGTFGAGCFWCVEAIYQRLDGVEAVASGYMGGRVPNPTYEEVCTGETGHAEVVQVKFDPRKISYNELLEIFWQLHDPTTLNRQGADVGTQYRSSVFYHSDEQKVVAERSRTTADESDGFASPIVTEVTEASEFFEAEGYHQDYFNNNPHAPICSLVIAPKIRKLGICRI